MPICKRANFEGAQPTKNIKNETFNDNDEVFFCEVTKEIFRDYEDYFRHVMVINSTVWQCEATGRDNLTYAEALKSEKRARKKMEQFKESLRAPVMLVIESSKQSSMNTLSTIVSKFLRKRYFLNECIHVIKSPNYEYKIIDIQLPDGTTPLSTVVYEDTENLIYKVQRIKGNGSEKDFLTVPFGGIRRQRLEFTTESLQMFIKHNVTRVDGILHPKPESYKRYIIDHNISFETLFIGKMPHFSPAKLKRPNADGGVVKKQSTMNKYLVKNNNEEAAANNIGKPKISAEQREKEKAERAEQKAKSLKEQMERLRLEKLEKIAKMEKEKAEKRNKLLEKISAECDRLLNKTEDLERTDQRLMPVYRSVETYVDDELIGDTFMVREFMHSFKGVLSGIETFRPNISFFEISRSFSTREIVGPLSDILLILIGTIFDLQKEEHRECPIEYCTPPFYLQKKEPYSRQMFPALTHFYTKQAFFFRINELPIDALTVSEVLRLHLLSSGSPVKDRTDKWRIMYRNGYNSTEDPGFHFVNSHSKILRALALYPIYQLSFRDIFSIIQCLMEQILTYSSPINLIEERLEQQANARNELRNLTFAENRRLANIQTQRRQLTAEHNQQCLDLKENIEAQKRVLEDKLNRKVAELLAQSERERKKYDTQASKLHREIFDYLVLLGMDRAYRKYYVFESLPGVFIEHNDDILDTCLDNPPTNMISSTDLNAADLPRNRKDLRSYLLKMYKDQEKSQSEQQQQQSKKSTKSSIDNKENQENRVVNGDLPNGNMVTDDQMNGGGGETVKQDGTDGGAAVLEEAVGMNDETKLDKPLSQTELYMCSGDPNNCVVHSPKHSVKQQWSYIYQQEELDELINSLNPLGERESQLREQLITLRPLIIDHSKFCPFHLLSIQRNRKKIFKENMLADTNRKYQKTNFGIKTDDDMNMVMQFALVERILQFEMDIYSGDLGKLKVKDMARWREDLLNGKYDPQVPLQWGNGGTQNGVKEDAAEEKEQQQQSNEKLNDESKEVTYMGKRFIPGEHLGDERGNEENDNFYLDIKMDAANNVGVKVKELASALLQVEQAIQRRFLKEPYGVTIKDAKDKALIEHKQKEAAERIKRWEKSLMDSTSYSQIFLHLNILHDCIIWSRSTNKSLCQICRRGSDPNKMLLCDECNGGTHMFCMKPKMKTVPEGNWYCHKCVNRLGLVNEKQQDNKKERKPKRKFIMDETDNSSETSSLSSSVQKDTKTARSSRHKTQKPLHDNEIETVLENDSDQDDAENAENSDADADADGDGDGDVDVDNSAVENESDDDEGNESNNEDDEDTQNDNATADEAMDSNKAADSSEEEDEPICGVCSYDGGDLFCSKCKDAFHLECVNLRRPPRYIFVCPKCRTKEQNKRKHKLGDTSNDDDDDGEEDDNDSSQPSSKRARPTRSSLRNSLQQNGTAAGTVEYTAAAKTSSRRSLRRNGDDLPLNSAAIYRLLEDVMKAESAWPFLRPVTHSEVPDYHKIIKTPMDLAKVKSKLNMGEYHLNEEVMNDIQLVFKNCEIYNEKENEVYQAGTTLEKSVIEICKDLQLPYIPSSLNK